MLVFIPSSLFLFFSNDIMNQQELLTQREQLMVDIDCIVDEFSDELELDYETSEKLIMLLNDVVCKNFPTK